MNTEQSFAQWIIATVEAHRGLIVLRNFDDCESEYFWLLNMTAPEFEKWWLEREEFWWPVYPRGRGDTRFYFRGATKASPGAHGTSGHVFAGMD